MRLIYSGTLVQFERVRAHRTATRRSYDQSVLDMFELRQGPSPEGVHSQPR